jgi:hypothetical protein
LLVSVHLNQRGRRWFEYLNPSPAEMMLKGAGGEYFQRHGPVGARDSATLSLLQRHGVPSYYSGCLTLTLAAAPDVDRSDEVIACDLEPPLVDELAWRLGRRPRVTSHIDAAPGAPAERFAKARALLDIYRSAKAVVTSRLHCALPCLALGTPVLLIHGREAARLAPGMELAHSASPGDFLRRRDEFDPCDPPANPKRHEPLATELRRRCKEFLGGAPGGQ